MFSLLTLLLAIPVIFLFFLRRSKSRNTKPYPPGPRGWELVRALKCTVDGTLASQTVIWSKQYGDLVYVPLPYGNLVLVNSSSVSRDLFATKSMEPFTNDRVWSYVADRVCLRKCVAFSSPSEQSWSKMRKLLHSSLKIYGDGLVEFERVMGNALGKIISSLDKKNGKDMIMYDLVQDSVVSIVGILITGEEPDPTLLSNLKQFERCVQHVLDPCFTFAIGLCPFLDYIPGTYYSKCRLGMQRVKTAVMKTLLYDMKDSRVPGSPRGIVDRLLDYKSNEGADWMTDDHVKGMITDLIVATTATVPHVVDASIFFLLHHADVMRKIQEEVDRVIGRDRKPSINDRRQCHYTEAFVLETLRKAGGLLSLDHLIKEDVQLGDYSIPAGSVAFMATYAINLDPKVWEDPDVFKPERFLDERGQLVPATHHLRHSLQAFGTGKRACPGEVFARARIFLYVTWLLQQFDILPPQTEKLLPNEKASWNYKEIICPKSYHCRFQRRKL